MDITPKAQMPISFFHPGYDYYNEEAKQYFYEEFKKLNLPDSEFLYYLDYKYEQEGLSPQEELPF